MTALVSYLGGKTGTQFYYYYCCYCYYCSS
jgi:hypothetical protein